MVVVIITISLLISTIILVVHGTGTGTGNILLQQHEGETIVVEDTVFESRSNHRNNNDSRNYKILLESFDQPQNGLK
jgi:hypothetical protein